MQRVIGISGYKRSGKDTVGGYLRRVYRYETDAFAAPFKRFLSDTFGWGEDQISGSLKEDVDPYWGFSPRFAMEEFGTGIGRVFDKQLWIKSLNLRVQRIWANDDMARVCLTDVRFPNEAEYVKSLGGIVIRVDRPGLAIPPISRITERSMDDWAFDARLVNDGSVDDLFEKVDTMLFGQST